MDQSYVRMAHAAASPRLCHAVTLPRSKVFGSTGERHRIMGLLLLILIIVLLFGGGGYYGYRSGYYGGAHFGGGFGLILLLLVLFLLFGSPGYWGHY
jgi:hypothetical protein